MNPSYIGYFGSFGAGRVRRFLGVRLWLLVLVVAIFGVCGVVGGERVYAASDEDMCYSIEWGDSTTNRVCSTVGLVDAGKLYAEKTDDVVRLGVKDNNVCLARYNDTTKNLDILECVEIGGNNGSTINDALKKILKDYEDLFPSGSVRSAKRRAKAWELTASELVLEERELQEARGDSNTDTCAALEYKYNGETRYTNKLCVNSNGALYTTNEGASDSKKNIVFVAPVGGSDKKAAMNINGNEQHNGAVEWNGVMALSEFAGVVWANACRGSTVCDDYELTGETLTADRDSEEWKNVNQTSLVGSEDSSVVCYKGSGAMGWILCPIIQGASGIGNYMWNQIEENHLKIPASEIFADNGGVYNGWEVVRNIANIAFVILFMVVIFSQLTGRGIDNYGIKKILPRLIVVAILMNMSYLICELAVDLSNIVGNGLNNLLSGLADGSGGLSDADTALSQANALEESSDFSQVTGWAAVAGLASGGTALFLLLNPAGAVAAAASIGLAVLGLVITIVVAMLTLYLILVIREAGIVILIVLAPVAMVCYTLPNMDKWFKKWLDLGKALLIVYPLCGLAVGGGQLAGAILGTIPNQSMKIAAMIVQVLPFFLIPTLLRRSLSLMGNVGARVSNIGRNLGRRGSNRAQGAIRNTNRFKDFSQRQQELGAYNRARRTLRRLNGRTNLTANELDRRRKAEDIVLAQNKREAENASRQNGAYFEAMGHKQELEREGEQRAVEQYNNQEYRDARMQSLQDEARRQRSKDRTIMASARYQGEGLPQLQRRWEDAFRNGDGDELDALTNVMTQRYGTSAANSIGQSLNNMHGIGQNENYRASMRTLQQTMNDNSAFAGNMKNKASDAFQMISDGGLVYDQQTGQADYRDLDYFSQHNNTSTDIKDWSTQSTATLQRAIDSGALTDDMIRDIMNSSDPAVQSGIQSDTRKRDLLQAHLYNVQNGTNLGEAQAAAEYRRAQRDAANIPTIRSSGAYRRRGGGVVQLNEMSNGTFVDAQNGQIVDIRHYTRE